MGRNGMGKTTTVSAIMGLLRARAGEVRFGGRPMTTEPPFRIAQAGIGLVPEGRQIFPTLTVEENLVAIAANRSAVAHAWTLERVYGFFPQHAERRRNFGDQISGGEQQMLAIGRALMTNPKLLILMRPRAAGAADPAGDLGALAARNGRAAILIDKNVEALLRLSDRHLILRRGA
jgi:branched-chain amino acid transport system ATP-binding protein